MNTHAWIITRDFLTEEHEKNMNAVGTCGPADASSELVQMAKENGKSFRLYDDDDILYYEGKFIINPDVNEDDLDGEEEFVPLTEFGEGHAGCTRIDYLENGEWETL